MNTVYFAVFATTLLTTACTVTAPVKEPQAFVGIAKAQGLAISATKRWEICTANHINAVFAEGRRKHPTRKNCIRVAGTTAWASAIAQCGTRPAKS